MVGVVSGKGGVGKTNVVANLAVGAAGLGAKVLVVDGDLGLANLDLVLGLVGRRNAADVLSGECRFDEALVEEHYRNAHLPGAHTALAAYVAGYLNHSVSQALSRLEMPVWIAWGRRAVSPRVESADLWLRHLPDAGLEVLEQCGVLPHAESPEELCRKLEQFLASLHD